MDTSSRSDSTSIKPWAVTLAAGGALIAAGGVLHPQGEPAASLGDVLWGPSHALLLIGEALAAVGLYQLVRAHGPAWRPPVRTAGWVAVIGLTVATIEMIPHLLAMLDAESMARGGPTPFHSISEAASPFANVLLGHSIAALAVVAASARALGGGWAVAALGVIGGMAFSLATPLSIITENPRVSILFSGGTLMGLWLLISGVLLARRTPAGAAPPATAVGVQT